MHGGTAGCGLRCVAMRLDERLDEPLASGVEERPHMTVQRTISVEPRAQFGMTARVRRELFFDRRLGEHDRRIAPRCEPAEARSAERRACLAAAVLARRGVE